MTKEVAVASGSGQSTDWLLDAAEDVFSEKGFEGAGMKEIAQRGGASQSLLHYHFGNKERLYEAVIARRSQTINAARLGLLDMVDPSDDGAMARIFEALFRPPLGPEGRGQSYARIFAGLAAGGKRDSALVRKYYDDTARHFVDALLAAKPGATRMQAARAYTMALGALVVALSGDARTARLADSDGGAETDDLIADLVTYACGGYDHLVRTAMATLGGKP